MQYPREFLMLMKEFAEKQAQMLMAKMTFPVLNGKPLPADDPDVQHIVEIARYLQIAQVIQAELEPPPSHERVTAHIAESFGWFSNAAIGHLHSVLHNTDASFAVVGAIDVGLQAIADRLAAPPLVRVDIGIHIE